MAPQQNQQRTTKIEPQYEQAYNEWKNNPNKQTAAAFLRSIEPIINRHIGSTGGGDSTVMRNKARLIIMKSLSRYDPNNTSLNTFLSQQLLGLRRETRRQNPLNIIKTPEHHELAYNRIKEAQIELSNKLDRPPTNEELADYLNMPVDHVIKYQTKTTARTEGGTNSFLNEGGDDAGITHVEVKQPISPNARIEYVYGELDDQDKMIFTRSPEYCEHFNTTAMTPSEMSKELNRSESYISNRKAVIQQKLEEADKVF